MYIYIHIYYHTCTIIIHAYIIYIHCDFFYLYVTDYVIIETLIFTFSFHKNFSVMSMLYRLLDCI